MAIQNYSNKRTHRRKQAGCCLEYRAWLEENSMRVGVAVSYMKMKCRAVSGESTIFGTVVRREERERERVRGERGRK